MNKFMNQWQHIDSIDMDFDQPVKTLHLICIIFSTEDTFCLCSKGCLSMITVCVCACVPSIVGITSEGITWNAVVLSLHTFNYLHNFHPHQVFDIVAFWLQTSNPSYNVQACVRLRVHFLLFHVVRLWKSVWKLFTACKFKLNELNSNEKPHNYVRNLTLLLLMRRTWNHFGHNFSSTSIVQRQQRGICLLRKPIEGSVNCRVKYSNHQIYCHVHQSNLVADHHFVMCKRLNPYMLDD